MSDHWHVPRETMERYADGQVGVADAMSVEAHLEGCNACRSLIPADDAWLDAGWDGIAQTVMAPRLTLLERALLHCGVPEHLARLLVATPTLSRAWLAAVAVVLAFAVIAAHTVAAGAAPLLPFLLVAPVLPLAGIALAYGPRGDPAYESLAALPGAGPRLLLLRASAVLVAALLPAGVSTALLPGAPLTGAAWLLPALALTIACLAASTRMPLPSAAACLAVSWAAAVLGAGAVTGDRMAAFQATAQLVYGLTAVALALVLILRRHRLDPGARP